jgi:hypothetical protein
VVAVPTNPGQKTLDAARAGPRLRALTTARVAEIGRQIDEVLCAPESRDEMRDLVSLLAARQVEGLALIVQQAAPAEQPRNLTAAEAAKILGTSERWLYDHQHELECTRHPSDGKLRFDSVGIETLRNRR